MVTGEVPVMLLAEVDRRGLAKKSEIMASECSEALSADGRREGDKWLPREMPDVLGIPRGVHSGFP